jgi:hypothetical protein
LRMVHSLPKSSPRARVVTDGPCPQVASRGQRAWRRDGRTFAGPRQAQVVDGRQHPPHGPLLHLCDAQRVHGAPEPDKAGHCLLLVFRLREREREREREDSCLQPRPVCRVKQSVYYHNKFPTSKQR